MSKHDILILSLQLNHFIFKFDDWDPFKKKSQNGLLSIHIEGKKGFHVTGLQLSIYDPKIFYVYLYDISKLKIRFYHCTSIKSLYFQVESLKIIKEKESKWSYYYYLLLCKNGGAGGGVKMVKVGFKPQILGIVEGAGTTGLTA